MSTRASYLLIFLLLSLSIFQSCQSKQSLKRDIANIMARDVKAYTKKAINKLTLGAGSRVIDNFIDDKMQDSIVLNNFITYVVDDLEDIEDVRKLREIKKNKKNRNLFLLQSLVKNSSRIKEDISSKFVVGAMIFEEIMKAIEHQTKK
jgi:hypothetical protein